MADDIKAKFSVIRVIVLSVLGVLSLACIVSGGFLYVWILADWSQGSSGFTGLQMIGWLVGLCSAAVVGVGLMIAGLFLRLLPWSRAPLASLLLSAVSAGFILLTSLVYSDTGNGSDSIEVVLLQGACVVGLVAVALPPFLHWLLARRNRPAARLSKVA